MLNGDCYIVSFLKTFLARTRNKQETQRSLTDSSKALSLSPFVQRSELTCIVLYRRKPLYAPLKRSHDGILQTTPHKVSQVDGRSQFGSVLDPFPYTDCASHIEG